MPSAPGTVSRVRPRSVKFDRLFLLLLVIVLLAFSVRVFRLDGQSIWWDEGISLHLATSDLADIAADRLDNIHPPLYFVLLKGWLNLTGVTAFTGRYLSVLAGWLQVPLAYALGARWHGRRTGLLAALLTAVSAVLIIYAQEIRVYAMLPLVYMALLAITRELTHATPQRTERMWPVWVALAVTSWLAVHLHYVALFALLYVAAWALLSFLRARRWADLVSWIAMQGVAALASLPWFLAVARNWSAVRGEANAGTFTTDPVPVDFLIEQVWAFHLTGLAAALSRPGIATAAAATAVLLLFLVVLRLLDAQTRRGTAVLLAHWLLPLSSALVVWLVRSFSHPRYVVMFVPGLLLLAAYGIKPDPPPLMDRVRRILTWITAVLLVGCLIGLSLWGLSRYFFDPDAAKDNVRAAARVLESETSDADLILVPDTDWSLPFEFGGEAQIAMPGLDRGSKTWPHLASLTAGTPRVFTLDYQRGTRDWQGVIPFALHKSGRQTSETEVDELILRTYVLDEPLSPPLFQPLNTRFGPLQLRGAWVEQDAEAGDALAVALQWGVVGDQVSRANVSLRLLDDDRRELAGADDRLLDATGRPSDRWPVDQTVTTYHVLPLDAAVPPLEYTLGVQVYEQTPDGARALDVLDVQGAPQGQTATIAAIRTARGQLPDSQGAPAAPDPAYADPVTLAPGLVLLEAAFPQGELTPGTVLPVELLWQATAPLPDLRPQLLLLQNGAVLAVNDDAPAGDRYPTTRWQPGEQVREVRALSVPAQIDGEARMALALGDQRHDLGTITIAPQDHVYTAPDMPVTLNEPFGEVAALVGFDLPQRPYTTAESVPLRLLWRSLQDAPQGDYVVFAHLLAEDGRLIGQHDGVPGEGQRPFSSWVAGEYILDVHDMVFRESDYTGPATVEIGLYDSRTGERLTMTDGAQQFVLPLALQIEPAD